MTFGELENILGFSLPSTARQKNQWWENEKITRSRKVQCKAWLDAGFHTENVSTSNETVDFVLGLPSPRT